jgi:hypothetical protein
MPNRQIAAIVSSYPPDAKNPNFTGKFHLTGCGKVTVGAVYDRTFPGINEICAVTDRAYKGMVLDSRHE